MTGDPYTAPLPAGPYASEVGTEPGKLRIGVRTAAPSGLAETDPVCIAGGRRRGALLTSLGHTVEDAAPAALGESGLDGPVQRGDDVVPARGPRRRSPRSRAGRSPPTTSSPPLGSTTKAAADTTAARTCARSARCTAGRGASCRGGTTTASTSCSRRRWPSRRRVLGDVGNQSDGGLNAAARSIPFAAYCAPFNVTGQPAMSVPLYWSESGLPIGVQLVGAPYREDLLDPGRGPARTSRPWAQRRPPVHA